jgi:hypothetical protein
MIQRKGQKDKAIIKGSEKVTTKVIKKYNKLTSDMYVLSSTATTRQ